MAHQQLLNIVIGKASFLQNIVGGAAVADTLRYLERIVMYVLILGCNLACLAMEADVQL